MSIVPGATSLQNSRLAPRTPNARRHINRFILRRLLQRVQHGETRQFLSNALTFARERFSIGSTARRLVQPLRWALIRSRITWTRFANRRVLQDSLLIVAAARDGRVYVARPNSTMTPVQIMQANLNLVVDALEAASIDYFLVKTARYRHRVGVRKSDLKRAVRALLRISGRTAAYCGRERIARLSALTPALATREQPLHIYEVYAAPGSSHVSAAEYACEVEFWDDAGNALIAAVDNSVAMRIPKTLLRPSSISIANRSYCSLESFTGCVLPEEITFPIDVVYTWVDGADPAWQARMEETARQCDLHGRNWQASNLARYENRDELRYSLRSIAMFAPFVRRIFIVTDDQVPPWLNVDSPRITMVSHRELFGDTGRLPTFNSHAIESRLHLIDGLSEHFLYFNDDVFLGRLVRPNLFFHSSGMTKVFLSREHIPPGPPAPDDWPADWGAKNARTLLQQHFGRNIAHKTKHVAMPMRRSVMKEIECRFPEAFRQTACAQFRSPTDIAPISSLYLHYACLSGYAVPGDARYAYLNVGSGRLPWDLSRLLDPPGFDVFCLNDTDSSPEDLEDQRAMIEACFQNLYPIASEFELPGS